MNVDIELMADTVQKMVDARLAEMESLAKSHGMQFSASVMLSVAAQLAGAALGTCRDAELQKAAAHVVILAMVNAMRNTGAELEAVAAIQKAMDKA